MTFKVTASTMGVSSPASVAGDDSRGYRWRGNEELTKSPAWAYRLGLLKHDGVCCQGRKVCSQYAEDGAA